MRARAGSALRPPTRTPEIAMPRGTVRVGVDAGVEVAARPEASTSAAKVLNTGSELQQFFQAISRNPSDGRRTLDSPMATGTWELAPCSHAEIRSLATALQVDDVTASVLVRRGLRDEA